MKHMICIFGCASVLVLVAFTKYCYSNSHGTFGKYEYGICPAEESKFREFTKISIHDCVKKCAVRPTCKVVGYNRLFKTCSLHLETSKEFVENPRCVRIKMDTVNIAQLSGDCNCAEWQVCDVKTGTCVTEECAPYLHPVREVLENTASIGAVKRVRCIDGLATNQPEDSIECQTTGEWSAVPKCSRVLNNIALHKPATQSSTYSPAISEASLAVDGNINQNYNWRSCFHTQTEFKPWWRVDLQVLSYIEYACLYNRMDGNSGLRAHDILVEVGDTLDSKYKVTFIDGILPEVHEIQFPEETYARIFQLTIQSADDSVDFFHLCEVEIYGYAGLNNIALHKPATQSSTYTDATLSGAKLAVDGNINQNYPERSCFHTQPEFKPWWRVDLQALSYIEYARLYNRMDRDTGFRAHDILVEVGETLDSKYNAAYIDGILPDVHEIQFPEETYARIFQLTIQSADNSVDIFHLCEVEIYGYAVGA